MKKLFQQCINFNSPSFSGICGMDKVLPSSVIYSYIYKADRIYLASYSSSVDIWSVNAASISIFGPPIPQWFKPYLYQINSHLHFCFIFYHHLFLHFLPFPLFFLYIFSLPVSAWYHYHWGTFFCQILSQMPWPFDHTTQAITYCK